jgi:hypothetical protein
MNSDPTAVLFEDPPKYLPPDLAGWLRTMLATLEVHDPARRADVVAFAEMCFGRGHSEGYQRGFADGEAERDAQLASSTVATVAPEPTSDGAMETFSMPRAPAPLGVEP